MSALDRLSSTELPKLPQALDLMIRLAKDAWSAEETFLAIRFYFIAECFGLFRRIYQDYRGLLISRTIEQAEVSRLKYILGGITIGDAIPWACARPDISFWVNADVVDRNYEVKPVRKRIVVPSLVYFPKFNVSRRDLIEFVVPQLLWYGLHFDDTATLELLELDLERLAVLSREEQLVGTVSFRRDYAEYAPELRAEARRATRDMLEQMIASGRLNDGLEGVDREQRLLFHLSQLRFLDRDRAAIPSNQCDFSSK